MRFPQLHWKRSSKGDLHVRAWSPHLAWPLQNLMPCSITSFLTPFRWTISFRGYLSSAPKTALPLEFPPSFCFKLLLTVHTLLSNPLAHSCGWDLISWWLPHLQLPMQPPTCRIPLGSFPQKPQPPVPSKLNSVPAPATALPPYHRR